VLLGLAALGVCAIVLAMLQWLDETRPPGARPSTVDDELRTSLFEDGVNMLEQIEAELQRSPVSSDRESSGYPNGAASDAIADRLPELEALAWRMTMLPQVRLVELVWADGFLRLARSGEGERSLEFQIGSSPARAYRQQQPGDRTQPRVVAAAPMDLALVNLGVAPPARSTKTARAWRASGGVAHADGIDADLQRVLRRSEFGAPLLVLRVRALWVRPDAIVRMTGLPSSAVDSVLLSVDPQGVVRATDAAKPAARNAGARPSASSSLNWVRLEWPLSGWQIGWASPGEGATSAAAPAAPEGSALPSVKVALLLGLGLMAIALAALSIRLRLRLRRDLALLTHELRQYAEPVVGPRLLSSRSGVNDPLVPDSEEFRLVRDLSRAAVQVREQAAAAAVREASGSVIVRQPDPAVTEEGVGAGASAGVELKRAHPIQQALREARAQLRETKAAYHKLQGRTSAEIASQQRLIEEAQRMRDEIESRYLTALQEIDQLRSQVSRARSRQAVVVKFKALQILLIEGNPISRQLFEGALLKLRMRADVVKTLEEAADAMQQLEYQAVIVGSSAPTAESQRTLDAIRKCFAGKRRPMLIWLERATARESALDPWPTGIDAILPTPLRLSDLRNVLERAALGDALPPAEQLAATALEPMLNAATLAQHKALDDEAPEPFMREVIEQFASNIPNVIEESLKLAAEAQWDRLARVIHKLRGTSLTLGAEKLERQCKLLEVAADEGNGEQVLALLDDFETLARSTSEALLVAALDFRGADASSALAA
jgi:HPt (histidine-containing phosphotransfer) domain-containing protein/CheY-like chemotaxis protein